MDRTALSTAIIAEMEAVVRAGLEETVPALLDADLATMEQRVQQLGRVIFGRLIEVVAGQRDQAQEQDAPQPRVCPACEGVLRRRVRPRHLQGVVGDYRLQRTYYCCVGCGQGQAPLDERLGLGPGVLSPGLARVVARAAIEAPFAQAVDQVEEALGVRVSEEVLRRTTESLGAVAEAQTQAALARAQQREGPAVWPPDALAVPARTTILAVEVDGVQVPHADAWHELKVVTVAPLGPDRQIDPDTGRSHLAWGAASYGVGTEGAEDFWWRVCVEAQRRGLGTAAVRTVVVLGDGAEWIWQRARTFLGMADTEVVEIVDIYHAYEYLWAVGNAVFGSGSPQAVAWVEPLKDRLYTQGAAPILAALALLRPPTPEAQEALHDAVSYFTTQAVRMDYPRFVARQFPIGSGAVESSCKCLVAARAKQAGMRWSRPGVQRLTSLRALHRSGRWDTFWRTQPHRQRPRERAPVPAAGRAPSQSSQVPAVAAARTDGGGGRAPTPPAPPNRPAAAPALTALCVSELFWGAPGREHRMARIGYARVSSVGQSLAVQLDKLHACDKIYQEKKSGTTGTRPRLGDCLEYVRDGDTLVVTRLDRLARSTLHLCQIAAELQRKGVALQVLDQQIDTTTSTGRLLFHMLGAIAQFETEIRAERQRDGIEKAKAQGVPFGRHKTLTPAQVAALQAARRQGTPVRTLMRDFRISRATVYRYLGQCDGAPDVTA